MQALRQFFEDGNVHNLADAGRDWASQILGQATGSTSTTEGVRSAIVSGNHAFNFSLKFEKRSEYEGLFQTGVLIASAETLPTRERPSEKLNLVCRWKRRLGDQVLEIRGTTDTLFHTSADDVGMHIICEAEVVDNPSMGRAVGCIGPFDLDPMTRINLENLLSSDTTSIPARHFRDHDPQPRDLQIRINQNYVEVVHPGTDRGSFDARATYSADYPRVILHPSNTSKFKLELSPDADRSYRFQALSRKSRDSIALLVRCCHARRYIATSFMLGQLCENPATPGAPRTSVVGREFDVQALRNRLRGELDRTAGKLQVVEKLLRNSTNEKVELQGQLRETIASYTEAIEKMYTQLANARGGPSAALQVKLHEARSIHGRLQLELAEVREVADEERRKLSKDGNESAAVKEVDGLRQDVQHLLAELGSLAGSHRAQSQREIARAEELRRLRADVDALSGEKEELELNCMRADKEKADLIESFMYVKGSLDNLQMASLEGPDVSPREERKLQQLKENFNQLTEERNRLAGKVEALNRDREKQKHQREATLERVMNANARLLEEKDKLEKEKGRISDLYQQTMAALGAASQGASAHRVESVAEEGQRETLATLRAAIEEKSDLLRKSEQEGDSLRHRLRRLAMA